MTKLTSSESILVTGANGFLGQHLCHFLRNQEFNVIATGRGSSRLGPTFRYHSCDLTDENAVKQLVSLVKPQVIIHTAAMSKPDECNINREACYLHNVSATAYLATAARNTGCFFIYTSTDFIFGEDGPHSEDEEPAPLNYYGECKLFAEQAIIEQGGDYAIVRPVFIYGPLLPGMRPSFVHWVKNNLGNRSLIKVVGDQQRTPTYVYDICKGIGTIIHKRATGAFHLAGKDILSPYQMASATAQHLGLDVSLITEVTSETFIEPVKRARRSGLKIDKARNLLAYEPLSFEEGLALTFKIL